MDVPASVGLHQPDGTNMAVLAVLPAAAPNAADVRAAVERAANEYAANKRSAYGRTAATAADKPTATAFWM